MCNNHQKKVKNQEKPPKILKIFHKTAKDVEKLSKTTKYV